MSGNYFGEWAAFQQFPAATQEKLVDLLENLKNKNVNKLTILVMGKSGVGKSSTVNSIIGEPVLTVSPFQSNIARPAMVTRSISDFTLNILDTPELVQEGYVSDQIMHTIKSYLSNETIDVLMYVDRLDAYRVDNLDKQVVNAITYSFGKKIWQKAILVLTHAQFSPPDGLSYDEFFTKRSESLLKCLGLKNSKKCIRVALVENWRCNKNENDEKILLSGTPWIPNLFRTITDFALNGKPGILVDKRFIGPPDPNKSGKILIPLILAFQYFFIIKPMERWMKEDASRENQLD